MSREVSFVFFHPGLLNVRPFPAAHPSSVHFIVTTWVAPSQFSIILNVSWRHFLLFVISLISLPSWNMVTQFFPNHLKFMHILKTLYWIYYILGTPLGAGDTSICKLRSPPLETMQWCAECCDRPLKCSGSRVGWGRRSSSDWGLTRCRFSRADDSWA